MGRFLSILLLAVLMPAPLAARSQASGTSAAAQPRDSGCGQKRSGSIKEPEKDEKRRDTKRPDKERQDKDRQDKDRRDKDRRDSGCADNDRLDKEALTPAQHKLDSHLLYEIEVRRGRPRRAVRTGLALVTVDGEGRALVEIHARILTQLGWKIARLKGTVVSTSPQYRSMIAWVPLLKLEPLASESIVSAIAPAPKSITVRPQHR